LKAAFSGLVSTKVAMAATWAVHHEVIVAGAPSLIALSLV
jgi:hypothetical protein